MRQVDPATLELARMLRFPKHSIDATFRLNVDDLPTVTVTYHPEDERGNLLLAHDCLRVIEATFELHLREQRDVTPPFDRCDIPERSPVLCAACRTRFTPVRRRGYFRMRLHRLTAAHG